MVGNSKLLKGLEDKLSRCSKSLYCCLPVCFLLILTNRSSHLTNLGGFALYIAIHYSSLRSNTYEEKRRLPFPATTAARRASTEIEPFSAARWNMPSLSDYGCEQCFLSLVEPKTISRLADTVHHRLIGDLLKVTYCC
jgi:hypothetical protein